MHVLGTDSGNSPWYLFYSGLFGVLVFIAQSVNAWINARKHNCHEPRCVRIGRFPVEGTAWTACRRHHPAPPQRGHIREQYHLYLGERPGDG